MLGGNAALLSSLGSNLSTSEEQRRKENKKPILSSNSERRLDLFSPENGEVAHPGKHHEGAGQRLVADELVGALDDLFNLREKLSLGCQLVYSSLSSGQPIDLMVELT